MHYVKDTNHLVELCSKLNKSKFLLLENIMNILKFFLKNSSISTFNRFNSEKAKLYSQVFDGAMDAIEDLQIPTISMIQGFCIGGGCELSTATDIRIASDKSKFGIPVAKLGISIGYREMKRLVNLIGPGNASYILLSAEIFDSKEALNMGLITRIINSSEIEQFTYQGRTFGKVKCYRAIIDNDKCGLLLIDRTHHDSSVVEIISEKNLRKKFKKKDGDEMEIELIL